MQVSFTFNLKDRVTTKPGALHAMAGHVGTVLQLLVDEGGQKALVIWAGGREVFLESDLTEAPAEQPATK